MQLRQINPDYLDYLRSFDPHIPEKDNRPWLWPVVIQGITYGIPCTSKDTGAGTAGYLRSSAKSDYGINIRFMAPIPQYALQPENPMLPGMQQQLVYWEEKKQYIEAEAQILHKLSGAGQMDSLFLRNSCDFTKLEEVYANWKPELSGLKEDKEMPISRNGKHYYTPEQYEAARYNGNALEYARSRGYELIRQGNGYYKMKEHDSMVFTTSGRWFWNSRGVSGGALEFMMYYEDRPLTEAVLTLAGAPERQELPERRSEPAPEPAPTAAEATEFRAPTRAINFKPMWYYLCQQRGLDPEVIREAIHQGILYQSTSKTPSGKIANNVAFLYKDPEGNAIGAFLRGMRDSPDIPPYKRDMPGSNKQYGWLFSSPQNKAEAVRVFEGAIDAASDASLAAMKDGASWRTAAVDRLSLEGLNLTPLQNYLKNHPDVQRIELMLDADAPGRRASAEFAERLREQGYTVTEVTPPFGKDWNEVLTSTREMEYESLEKEG